jgi:hypothetical protein
MDRCYMHWFYSYTPDGSDKWPILGRAIAVIRSVIAVMLTDGVCCTEIIAVG